MIFTYDELKNLNKERLIMHIIVLQAIIFSIIKLKIKEKK